MRGVEVRLLGPVEVVVDGQAVDLGGARQRLVIARLGLAAGRAVPVDSLLDLLWPDGLTNAAIGNLQSYVSRVRRRIGKEVIVKEPGGYRLALERSQVDVLRVEDALARLDELDPMERAEQLDDARRLWRGRSLSDLTDWLGLLPDSVRLDELHLHVVGLWARAVLDIDRHDLALSVLPSLAPQHPTNEPIQLALVEALARARRNDDALRVGHRFRSALAETSGLQPGDALEELERRILADGVPSETRAMLPAAVPPPPANSFVGRGQDLQHLAELIEHPGVVEVVGPAGVGKTRLVLELLRRRSGSRPVRFVDLAAISEPERLGAAIGGAIGAHVAGSTAELADALEADSVLVVDACEHLASDAGAVVTEIARRRHDVTVVCTTRTRLTTESRCADLSPLQEVDATRLFLERTEQNRPGFDSAAVTPEDLGKVIAATDGLPLAVELLSGRERIVGVEALARQAVTDRFTTRAGDLLPELVNQLDRSYQAISPASRRLLRWLSIAPDAFELDLAELLTDQPVSTLAELIDSSLVAVEHSSKVRYRLLDSVRAVGLAHLDPHERRQAQAALAGWAIGRVEEWRRDQDDRLAGPTAALREHTPLVDAALTWLIDASRLEDASRLAVDIAMLATDDPSTAWLQRLRSLAVPTVDGEPDALFAIGAATAAWIAGDTTACGGLLEAGRAGLPAGHELAWCIDFVAALAAVYGDRANDAERHARALHDDARGPEFARATAVCGAALAHSYGGRADAAARLMDLDADLLDRVGERDGFIDFAKAELASRHDPSAAIALLSRAAGKCATAGHDYNGRIASIAQLGVLVRTERLDQSAELAPPLIAACCHTGMWPQAWIVARLSAELLAARGQYLEAATLVDAATADPSAPTLAGPDLDRIRGIRRRCDDALDDDQRRQVLEQVSGLERSDLPTLVATALGAG